MIQILDHRTGDVIYESEAAQTVKAAVEEAVAKGVSLRYADLANEDLSSTKLSRADFRDSILTDVNFCGADVSGANFSDANLGGANFGFANLYGARLVGAYLKFAEFYCAKLLGANLSHVDLKGAVFYDLQMIGVDFCGANLRDADLELTKKDLIGEALKLPNELDALRTAIIDGKIDGSCYSGECCCFAGTLAKARGDELSRIRGIDCGNGLVLRLSMTSPRERWFLAIKPGDTPETNPFSAIALEWVDEAIAIRDNIRAAAAR